uniref:Smoothelin n=2 Tax=Anas platyrhynchos TaxID=8839 RepID=A0A493T3H7_ANAPP
MNPNPAAPGFGEFEGFWEGSHIRAAPCLQDQNPRGLLGGQHQATRGRDLLSPGPPPPRPAATGQPKTGTGGGGKSPEETQRKPGAASTPQARPPSPPFGRPRPRIAAGPVGAGRGAGRSGGVAPPFVVSGSAGAAPEGPRAPSCDPGEPSGRRGGGSAGMSQENLLGMDEGALRKLLEATLDLAERRRIRSAIRELQRQELERDEEALASKRFRPERGSHRQDNKENWLRSQQLEEEQQKALASLSRELESITDVEELTKLLRAASEYEERKLIRAAIRKLRAEEIEAATLAGNVQSNRRHGTEPPAVPAEGSQRDDAEAPALSGNGESSQRGDSELPAAVRSVDDGCQGSTEALAVGRSVEDSQGGDAEQPVLDGTEESSHGGDADQLPAEELERPVAHEQDASVEQEHGQTETQELNSQQLRGPQKPSAQGTASGALVILDLHPAPEPASAPEPAPALKPEDHPTELEQVQPCTQRVAECEVQYQASWKDKSPSSPSATQEPHAEQLETPRRTGQSRQAEQHPQHQPGAVSQGNQFVICVRGQASGKAVKLEEKRAAPTRDAARTPSRLNTHRWEQAPAGRVEPSPDGPIQRSSSVRERAQRFAPAAPTPSGGPEGAGGGGGRAGPAQLQRGPRSAPSSGIAQNSRGGGGGGGAEQSPAQPPAGPRPVGSGTGSGSATAAAAAAHDGMKTYFTIEIKDGRVQPLTQSLTPRVVAAPGSQRAELTLGLRSTPIRITTIPSGSSSICISSNVVKDPCAHFEGTEEPGSPVAHPPTFSSTRQQSTVHLSRSNSFMEPEAVEQPQAPRVVEQPQASRVVEQPQAPRVVEQHQASRLEPELPNGMEKVQVKEVEKRTKLNVEELNRIEDEDVLDKMLDQTTDFEERRLIRNAMRELRQRKRDQREKERDQRLQEMKSQATAGRAGHTTETTTTQSSQSADGSARSTVTKTERLIQSNDGTKTSRTTTMESSYVKRTDNGSSTFVQTKSSYSSSSKKTGSIFDREDETASRQSSLAALERRQAEKKKELMKAQSLPKTSASQARKAMIEKLQKEGGSSPNPAAARTAVQRSSSFGVPNASSIKQMLLDWCRAKTRGYEHVDIQNFSSSWSDGMAFCALVHNFFPEAFDYSQLTPQNRRHNFEVAFSSAEKHADCPQLLDVEDMVRMREPDWKCVYTYIQEFYRCLVQKGLVKTKKS